MLFPRPVDPPQDHPDEAFFENEGAWLLELPEAWPPDPEPVRLSVERDERWAA